jgi:hypothetical protein
MFKNMDCLVNKFSRVDSFIINCAEKGNHYMVVKYLKEGGSIYHQDKNTGEILLFHVIGSRNVNLTSVLVRHILSDFSVKNIDNEPLIFSLLFYGHYDTCRYVILNKLTLEELNVVDQYGYSLLFRLLEKKFNDTAMYIINQGVNINEILPESNKPLIFHLIEKQMFDSISLIINAPTFDINTKYNNVTLLEKLIVRNSYKYIYYLIRHTIQQIHIPPLTSCGRTFLELASIYSDTLTIHELYQYECARLIQKCYRGYRTRSVRFSR